MQRLNLKRLPMRPGHVLHVFNFFRWHVIIGILVPLAAAGILCACSTADSTIPYIDALFMCTSALTLTGLTVVEVGPLSFGQQWILYVLFQFGSLPSVSLLTLIVRRATFNKRFSENKVYFPTLRNQSKSIEKDIEAAEVVLRDDNEMSGPAPKIRQGSKEQDGNNSDEPRKGTSQPQKQSPSQPTSGRGGFPNPLQKVYSAGWSHLRRRFRTNAETGQANAGQFRKKDGVEHTGMTQDEVRRGMKKEGYAEIGHNIWQRNSDVRDLTKEQHIKLARLEISAMTYLLYTVASYWIGLQLLTLIVWAPYFSTGHYDSTFTTATSRTWFSVFEAASALNNCGISLVDTSLTNFQTAYLLLIPMVILIFAGDIGFPIALRAYIYLINACLPKRTALKRLGRFILEHPRRVFIYLFPPYETMALVVAVAILTSVDWICFYLLNIGYLDDTIYSLPGFTATVDGLVQSVSVRSAGFYTVNLWQTAPALHCLYIFMMIFAVYPVALTIRATNVYEEKALGMTNTETSMETGLQHLRQEEGYVGLHLKEQLAYDVWFIIFATWLICIVERNQLEVPATSSYGTFSVFDVIFEVCSAYANVGLSIGSPSSNTSTSSNFRHLSKLILCLAMLRGRTRGLPVRIDRSIMTPRELDQIGDPPETCSGLQAGQAAEEADAES